MMLRDQTADFLDYIREHATQYFANIDSAELEVQFAGKQERRVSILYRFRVFDKAQNHEILVKVPIYREFADNNEVAYSKPKLIPKTDLKDKYKLEFTALGAIYKYFSGLDDNQLKAVYALDYLPQYQAILVECYDTRSLVCDANAKF